MTEYATGGIVSNGQSMVVGEHGCSLTVPPRARRVITGSFRVDVAADTVAWLEALVAAPLPSRGSESE